MRVSRRHPWTVSIDRARDIQLSLRDEVVAEDRLDPVRLVAGVDVGFEQDNSIARAAIAVLDFPDLNVVETAVARRKVRFPYVPGFLSFREMPAILAAFERLQRMPNLVLCDGQGLAHPRRFGIACHFGVLTGLPAIGAAKTRLVGEHHDLPPERGTWRYLRIDGEVVGAALRTRAHTRPLFVSVGHRISLRTAIHYVLACCTKYRLPETTRMAHRLASN